jgi:hypothetical protein
MSPSASSQTVTDSYRIIFACGRRSDHIAFARPLARTRPTGRFPVIHHFVSKHAVWRLGPTKVE